MIANISKLLRVVQKPQYFARELNCWTAAITKKHRKTYERSYPTVMVLPDGSSINVQYHEPKKIVVLPLDITLLTDEEHKARLEKRKPRSKVIITQEVEDDFDETRYLKIAKNK